MKYLCHDVTKYSFQLFPVVHMYSKLTSEFLVGFDTGDEIHLLSVSML